MRLSRLTECPLADRRPRLHPVGASAHTKAAAEILVVPQPERNLAIRLHRQRGVAVQVVRPPRAFKQVGLGSRSLGSVKTALIFGVDLVAGCKR